MLKTNGLQYKIDIWLKAHHDTENKKKSKLQLVTREHSDNIDKIRVMFQGNNQVTFVVTFTA